MRDNTIIIHCQQIVNTDVTVDVTNSFKSVNDTVTLGPMPAFVDFLESGTPKIWPVTSKIRCWEVSVTSDLTKF